MLLEGLEEITFSYLGADPEETETVWEESWNPEETRGVPGAVRLILQKKDRRPPVTVIARIPSLREEVRQLAQTL